MAYIEPNRSPALNAALRPSRLAIGWLGALKSALETTQRRQKLHSMSPHLLRDIGLSEGDISILRAQQDVTGRQTLNALHLLR